VDIPVEAAVVQVDIPVEAAVVPDVIQAVLQEVRSLIPPFIRADI
jgi:hypothetical protein